MIVDFIQLKSNIKFFFFFLWNLSLTIFMAIVTMQIRTVKTLFLGGWWNFSLKKFMAIITTKTGMVKAFFFFFFFWGTLVWQYLWPLLECWKFYSILFYHQKKLLYQLYHIILQHTQHPIFYFPIQYIKIIYLYNKIYFSLLLKKNI